MSVSFAQRQVFVTARVFDIMQFDNMCNYCGSRSLPTRIIERSIPLSIYLLKVSKETLEKGVKPVQS